MAEKVVRKKPSIRFLVLVSIGLNPQNKRYRVCRDRHGYKVKYRGFTVRDGIPGPGFVS